MKQSGFSIIELLVAISILILISGAVWAFGVNTFLLNRFLAGNLTAQYQAREVFKAMSAQIRSASPSSLGAYTIEQAQQNSFIFYVDFDNDGLKERVRYFLENNTFKRGIIKPQGDPLVYNPLNELVVAVLNNINNGVNPAFAYYDGNYSGKEPALSFPVNIPNVRLVKITLNVKYTPDKPSYFIMTTQVCLRNLKSEI